jgi:hypothetical protein
MLFDHVRFEVFTAVTMKNAIFWDVMPCGSCKNQSLRGMQRLHPQGERHSISSQGASFASYGQRYS